MVPRSMMDYAIQHNRENEVGYKRVCVGDFVVHLRSFQGGFAHSYYEGITSPAYHVFRARERSHQDDRFWRFVFSSSRFIHQLHFVTFGIRDGKSISFPEFLELSLRYAPTLDEQQAIGAIFTNLDAAINQHTLKHKALQQAKTALMQRMFPQEGQTVPELRLEGFSGEWAMVELSSIAQMYQPQTISGGELQPSGIPVFGANGFIGFYHSANHQNDQVTISARGEKTGTPSYVPGPAWITGNSMVVNVDSTNIDKRFLYADLGAMYLKKFVTGGAQPQLTREVLNKVEVPTPPTLEEQQAIGAVFTKLDTLISAEAQYIASLKQAKTALLQRMFI